MHNYKILGIETATEVSSVALCYSGKMFQRTISGPRQSAEQILLLIDSLFQETQLSLIECDAIAFSKGPGSFIGVRLAASVAQGLGVGANIPVIPVSSLHALAQVAFLQEGAPKVVAGWDARMGQIYWGVYSLSSEGCMQPDQADQLSTPEDMYFDDSIKQHARLVGNPWQQYASVLPASVTACREGKALYYPNATALVLIAEAYYRQGFFMAPEDIDIAYLRNAVARQPGS